MEVKEEMVAVREHDATVSFDGVTALAETDKAVLCLIDDEEVWIPQGQIHDDSEVWKKGDEGTLIVSEWIAMQKGLI